MIYLFVGLLLPLLYHGISKLWYYIWLDLNVVDMLSKNLRTYFLTNPLLFDTIFCILMIIIVAPIFKHIRKEEKIIIPKEFIVPINKINFIKIVVITFGISGVTMGWQILARTLLKNVSIISESTTNFDKVFATPDTSHSFFWMFLSVAILGPIIEELIFRGVLFSTLNKYLPGIWVVIITAIYFGLWHSNPMQMVYTAILGIFVGLVYASTRNMWFPMLIHLINNIISTPPPFLENSETYMLIALGFRVLAIIPMLIIVYRMVKNSSVINLKISN